MPPCTPNADTIMRDAAISSCACGLENGAFSTAMDGVAGLPEDADDNHVRSKPPPAASSVRAMSPCAIARPRGARRITERANHTNLLGRESNL